MTTTFDPDKVRAVLVSGRWLFVRDNAEVVTDVTFEVQATVCHWTPDAVWFCFSGNEGGPEYPPYKRYMVPVDSIDAWDVDD